MAHIRMEPKERKAQLLAAAIEIYHVVGICGVTQANVARKCGVTAGTVALYFKTRDGLRRAVARKVTRGA